MRIRAGVIPILATTCWVAACSPSETGTQSAEDDFIPARDLSLSELAASRPGPEFERVVRTTRPSAFERILAAREAGGLRPAEADALALRLRLGQLDAVPEQYLADEALVTVPDFEPYLVRLRMAEYTAAEQATLREILAEYGTPASPTAGEPGILRRLLGPEPAYAAPGVAGGAAAGTWVEVVADDVSETSRIGETASVAESVWPQIASFMQVTVGDFGLDDVVRFSEPLGPDAQQFLEDSGLPPTTSATITGHLGDKWIIDFGDEAQTAVDDAEIELVDPAQPPLRIHLTASPAGIPSTAATDPVGGSFLSCRNIFIVTGDGAGSCTLAGRVVHELFHCAQALRAGGGTSVQLNAARERWVIEGTAMWSMDNFRPTDDHEWASMEEYAAVHTTRALDQLHHYAGLYFSFVDTELGGSSRVRGIFDEMIGGSARSQLAGAFNGDPANWHKFVNSSTGYDDLLDSDLGVQLLDSGGGSVPYQPTVGCADDGSKKVGQEYFAHFNVLSAAQAPIFDLVLPGPAAQHEIVSLVDVEELQYIDVGLFGDLADKVSTSDPEVRITAVLITQSGTNEVQDWSERWTSADGMPMEINDFGITNLIADQSFRICMTDDAPCEDADETFADLSEIRLVFSWAGTPPSVGETLTGQLALLPGGIRGWRGKSYRRGTPEDEHEESGGG